MKKIFLITIVSLFTITTKAQGNLQFNQVLTYTGALPFQASSPDFTCPAGKVWKVQGFSYVGSGSTIWLTLNGVTVSNGFIFSSVSNYPSNIPLFENQLWTKAGDNLKFNTSNSGNGTSEYWISIMEYNIVP